MKTFRQFKEAVLLKGPSVEKRGFKYTHDDSPTQNKSKVDMKNALKMGETPDHHIFVKKYPTGGNTSYAQYYAVNKKSGHVDLEAHGTEHSNFKHKNTTFQPEHLLGREGSTLKAHDFYHHLITKHNRILVGRSHTEGGMKVWQRLSNHKDVHIHGFHDDDYDNDAGKHGKGQHINPKNRIQTHTPVKMRLHTYKEPTDRRAQMLLVAHKRDD